MFDFEAYLRSSAHLNFGVGFGFLRCNNPDKIMEPIMLRIFWHGGRVVFRYKSYYDVQHDLPWHPEIPQPLFNERGPPNPFESAPTLGGFKANYHKEKGRTLQASLTAHVTTGPFSGYFGDDAEEEWRCLFEQTPKTQEEFQAFLSGWLASPAMAWCCVPVI